jgi:hypothetical protein
MTYDRCMVDVQPELPGADIVARGLADLYLGSASQDALLVSIASPRLRRLGIEVPELPKRVIDGVPEPYEHRLYDVLSDEDCARAHSRYNALLRRMVSYTRAAEHAPAG